MTTPQLPEKNWRKSVASIVATGRMLHKARKEMSRTDYLLFTIRKTGLDESASHKIINIANHPILSDPKNESKLPAGWVKLYNLGRLPDDMLLQFIADGRAISLKKEDMRDVLYGNARDRRLDPLREDTFGAPIYRGDGLVSDAVRAGIELERNKELLPKEAAKQIGLSDNAYMKLRKVILLTERSDLTASEQRIVTTTIENVNRTRRLRRYTRDAEPIIERVWGKAKRNHVIRLGKVRHNRRTDVQRKHAFHTAIVVLTDTCNSAPNLEIPPLSEDERARSIGHLREAKKSLSELSRKIWRSGK